MAEPRNSNDPPAQPPGGRSRSRAAEPKTVGATVTHLADWKYRRVVRDMGEAFGHPPSVPPCTGVCECWGVPLGGGPR